MSVIFNGYKFACGYRVDMEYLRDFLEDGTWMEPKMDNALAAVLVEGWYARRIPEDQQSSCPKPIRLTTIKDATCNDVQVFLLTRFEIISTVADGSKLDEAESDKAKRQKFIEFANLFRKNKSFDVRKTTFDVVECKTTTIRW
ncbi:hypothetical protein NLJ89_g2322 [Agrocybe chaxingu]|uniref:Uncharacterized protein n=1 Tax=Agrocybe chaxingu TaxID=84603 RepID=A0A9W8K709_9AGAR|nr:hypothetical protein NLJ89_g2322 [Agrocybe chaxingu]